MRNLKRMLSLALASVMVIGMMAVGAGAVETKATDFPDMKDVIHKEAVEVMIGTGIIAGTDKGVIDPKGVITREAAAKIIAYMKLGKTVADALTADKAPFTDVAATRWSAGYIAYCADQGIISGYAGAFTPEGPVTGLQLSKMMLIAAGYGVNDEYVGDNWARNAATDGLSYGVFEGNVSGATNNNATREETMLYAFNTLTTITPVRYSSVLGSYYDTTVMLGDVKNKTLGETVFKLKAVDGTDANGMPGYQWAIGDNEPFSSTFNNTKVIATKYDLSTMTKGDMFKLGSWNTTFDLYVNGTHENGATSLTTSDYVVKGSTVKLTDAGLAQGYKGATIQFCDTKKVVESALVPGTDGKIDTMIVSMSFLAEVTKVTEAKGDNERTITLKIHDLTSDLTKTVTTKDFAKGDYILVTPSANNPGGYDEPTAMVLAEKITGKVSAYKAGSVTVDGTAYGKSGMIKLGASLYTTPSFTDTYDMYLDDQGNVIGVKVAEAGDSVLNYAYVLDAKVQVAADDLINGAKDDVVKVKVVYMDGVTESVDYAVKTSTSNGYSVGGGDSIDKGSNYIIFNGKTEKIDSALETVLKAAKLCAYTKDSDGNVTLKNGAALNDGKTPATVGTVVDAGSKLTAKKNTAGIDVGGTVVGYANDKTNLVVAKGTSVSTATGYKNFPSSTNGEFTASSAVGSEIYITYVKTGSTVTNILVIGGDLVADTTKSYGVYAGQGTNTADGTNYNFFVDGEIVTYLAPAGATTSDLINDNKGKAVEISLNDKGELDGATLVATTVTKTIGVVDSTYVVIDDVVVKLAEDCKVYNVGSATSSDWAEDTLEVGDVVSYGTNSVNGETVISVIFITTEYVAP